MGEENWETLSKRRQGLREKANAMIEARNRMREDIMSDPSLDGQEADTIVEIPTRDSRFGNISIKCTKREAALFNARLITDIEIKEFRDWIAQSGVLYGESNTVIHKYADPSLEEILGLDEDSRYRELMDLYRKDGNQEVLDKVRESIMKTKDSGAKGRMVVPLPGFDEEWDFNLTCELWQADLFRAGFIELVDIPEYRDLVRRRCNLELLESSDPEFYQKYASYAEEDEKRREAEDLGEME